MFPASVIIFLISSIISLFYHKNVLIYVFNKHIMFFMKKVKKTKVYNAIKIFEEERKINQIVGVFEQDSNEIIFVDFKKKKILHKTISIKINAHKS